MPAGLLSITLAAAWLMPAGVLASQGSAVGPTRRGLDLLDLVNVPPVALPDAYSLVHDRTLDVPAPGVLGNDVDADGDTLSAELDSGPSHGDLHLNSKGSLSYSPDRGFVGTDVFSYHASDGTASSLTVSVTLSVTDVAPVAVADAGSTPYETKLRVAAPGVLGNDVDADGDPLSASLAQGPANGKVDLSASGAYTYTPDSGFSGTDSFVYRASDGAKSDAATVTILVAPPIATPSPTISPNPSLLPSPTPSLLPSPTPSGTPGPTGSTVATPSPSLSSSSSPPPGRGSSPGGTTGAGSGSGGGGGSDPRFAGPRDRFTIQDERDAGLAGSVGGALTVFGSVEWAVPGLVLTVPGLLLVLALLAQAVGALTWLPLVRRRIGVFGLRRGS